MTALERWLLLPLSIAIAATAIGLLVYARLSPEPTFPTQLQSVDPADFSGFTLIEPPPNYQPEISQFAAEEAALASGMPGDVILESALVRVIETLRGTVRTVWAVSIDPEAPVPPSFPCYLSNGEPYVPKEVAYHLRFIDAETGEWLSSAEQATEPPSQLSCRMPSAVTGV
jgi:hypothetical protein